MIFCMTRGLVRPRSVDGDGAAHRDDVHEGERRRGRLEGGKDDRSCGAPAVLVRRRLPRARVYPRGDLFEVRGHFQIQPMTAGPGMVD